MERQRDSSSFNLTNCLSQVLLKSVSGLSHLELTFSHLFLKKPRPIIEALTKVRSVLAMGRAGQKSAL